MAAPRRFLSLTAVCAVAGVVLGRGGVGLLDFDPQSGLVRTVAVIALIVILFRDGVEVEAEMLQTAWRLPLRKLVLAMPITCALVACATAALTDLSWTQAFLVGALLSPTDPVLSSSVVTNPRVPRVIRHSLNLESGLNDGLALPAVLAFAAALDPAKSSFVWWHFVLKDLSLGFAVGVAAGFAASYVLPRQKALLGLVAAFATYGLAHIVEGNGLIAVFVAAITVGVRRADVRASFESRSQHLVEAVKLGVFVVFGAVVTLHGLFGDGGAAVAIVAFTLLAARPLAVWVALFATRTDAPTRLFMGWFGPKGVATMTFSLLILNEGIRAGGRMYNIAALAVFTSVIAHGLTDKPGSDWMARHAERRPA